MNYAPRRVALLVVAFRSFGVFFACGGQTGESGIGADTGACTEQGCGASEVWNPSICACDLLDAQVPMDASDATIQCPPVPCPFGSIQGIVRGQCSCVPEAGPVPDGMPPADAPGESARLDAPPDTPSYDSPFYVTDAPYYDVLDATRDATRDAPASPLDAPYERSRDDAPYYAPWDASYVYYPDAQYCELDGCGVCGPNWCGPGYQTSSTCQCVACTNTCAPGMTPAAGCGSCIACPYQCPAGFDHGSGCSCVPHGTDAGAHVSDAGDGGGMTCLLEGQIACAAGSWCSLGVCPDNTTQYGCYCNQDGTTTCQLNCPQPPPCTIPGEGTCAFGTSCTFGNCAANPAGTALVCDCGYGGSASCFTSACSALDGGADAGGNPAGGVTCLLGGYTTCRAGSWCELGLCPDGTTQYGCYCNADGTSTCQLSCPPPPPCTIPGEGVCAYGTSCTFGSCSGGNGIELNCFCGSGGSASCYTSQCSDGGNQRDY